MNASTLEQAVKQAWLDFEKQVEAGMEFPFDHEFTYQFHLAWNVARSFSFSDRLNVRFEVPCGHDRDGETIRLDLLVWIDPAEKVAIELKAPSRSETKMNSAMTQFRMRFYKDIHRLWHLVESSTLGIRRGVFLAVVNENGYVIEGGKKVNADYRTYHGVSLPCGTTIPPTSGPNGYPYPMHMPHHEITWKWKCESKGGRITLAPGCKHYWLEPISVRVA